jgi:hypothetical protein
VAEQSWCIVDDRTITMANAYNVRVACRICLFVARSSPPDSAQTPATPRFHMSPLANIVAMSLPILPANATPNLLGLPAKIPQYDLPSSFVQNKAHPLAYTSYHCSHTGRVTSILRSPRLLGDTPNVANCTKLRLVGPSWPHPQGG